MATFAELQGELMAAIYSVWPEITPPNVAPCRIFTTMQAMAESFVERVEDGRTALPCAVLEIGRFDHDPEWGVNSNTYRAPVEIFYIAQLTKTFAQPQVDAKLRQVLAAIQSGSSVAFDRPPEKGTLDSSPTCPANAALAGKSKIAVVAGGVSWNPGLLVEI